MRIYCITKSRNWIIQKRHQFISTMDCWHFYRWSASIASFPVDAKILSGFRSYLSPESNKLSIIYQWLYTYIYSRTYIFFCPALFLDRGSYWEREKKIDHVIIFLQNMEPLTEKIQEGLAHSCKKNRMKRIF